MLITLKQREIEAAVRQYIASNGINLVGKTVEIAFTAGRKESGLSAEVDIEGGLADLVVPAREGCQSATIGAETPIPVAECTVTQVMESGARVTRVMPQAEAAALVEKVKAAPATEAKETLPFEPDAPKAKAEGDPAPAAEKKSISLFGG